MKIVKYALLLSGLFFSFFASAQVVPKYDPADFVLAQKKQSCTPKTVKAPVHDSRNETAQYDYQTWLAAVASNNNSNCSSPNTTSIRYFSCSRSVVMSYTLPQCGSTSPVPITRNRSYSHSSESYKLLDNVWQWVANDPYSQSSTYNANFSVVQWDSTGEKYVCENEPYTIGPIDVGSEKRCYKPLEPLDCSGLKGLGASALYDSYITATSAGYSKANQPSCLTKCAKDSNGVQKCGDCKVAASSWSYQSSIDGSTQKWWANAGTFTGAACGEKESEEPPPEATKCWETTNGLSMCIQDPAEKCVTVSGVQQCEAGCGYVNGEFYCAEKEPPKPNPNDKDKPLPDPDDNISNPEKPIADMNKGDFKDVQRGVESRVASVGVAVGNLENSVDGLGNTLDSMNDKLDKANGIGEAQLGYLKGIKDGILGGDDGGEPDGNCDPLKDKKCDGNTGASGIKSWWNSKYPEGINTLLAEKKNEFTESAAFQAMTQELTLTGGAAPDWRMCFDALGFGCYSLNVPAYIWNFIRACMLFGAAILSRRLLIGG